MSRNCEVSESKCNTLSVFRFSGRPTSRDGHHAPASQRGWLCSTYGRPADNHILMMMMVRGMMIIIMMMILMMTIMTIMMKPGWQMAFGPFSAKTIPNRWKHPSHKKSPFYIIKSPENIIILVLIIVGHFPLKISIPVKGHIMFPFLLYHPHICQCKSSTGRGFETHTGTHMWVK